MPRSTSRGSAGSTCTSRCCRPGAERRRCSTRSGTATTSPAPRRSCSRRASTPGRCTAWSPRPSPPTDTSGDLLGRLARLRRRPARRDDGRPRGRCARRRRRSPSDGVSLAPKITVEDAEVDWTQPAVRVDRQVRACTPAPGAWTTYVDERLKLGPVDARSPTTPRSPPASSAVDKNRVRVGTASHAVVLGEVRAQGKQAMAAADWARGTRPAAGAKLGAMTDGPRGHRSRPVQWRPDRRPTDPARLAAYDILRAVDRRRRLRQPRRAAGARRRRPARPRRRLRHDPRLRHAAPARVSSTPCSRRAARDPLADDRPAGARRAAPRRAAAALPAARPPHAAVGETVQLARLVGGEARSKFANAVLRRVGERDLDAVGRAGRPRPGRPTRSATSRSCSRTRAGSSRRCTTRSRRGAASAVVGRHRGPPRRRQRERRGHPRRPAGPQRRSTSCSRSRGARPGRWSPYAVTLEGGDPGADRPRCATATRACRTRAASSSRSRSRARPDRGRRRTLARPGRRPRRQGRAARRRSGSTAARRCWPSTARTTAPGWSRARSAARRATTSSSPPTAATARGARRRSTGCCSTPRAPASVCCAGAPSRGGGANPPTSPRSPRCSASCSTRRCRPSASGGVVGYATCSPHVAETDVVVAARAAPGRRRAARRAPAAARGRRPRRRPGAAAVAARARHRRHVPRAAASRALTRRGVSCRRAARRTAAARPPGGRAPEAGAVTTRSRPLALGRVQRGVGGGDEPDQPGRSPRCSRPRCSR